MSPLRKKLQLAFDTIYILFGFIKLIFKSDDISPIFVTRSFREHESFRLGMQSFYDEPSTNSLIRERYLAPDLYDLEALKKLPEGSLGRCFADHMIAYKLAVEFYPPMEDKRDDDLNYMIQRARQTHDIHHVVLGYPAVDVGEMAISAFYLSQNRVPLSAFLIGVGFFHTIIKKPHRIEELMNALILGWTTGKQARCFLGHKWEEDWETPLEDLRRHMKVPTLTPLDFYRRIDSQGPEALALRNQSEPHAVGTAA